MGLCTGSLAGGQPPAPAFSLGARQRLACPSRATPPRSATPWSTIHRQPMGAPRSQSRGKRHRREALSSPQQETQDQPHPGLASFILFLRVRGHRVTRHSPSLGVRRFPQRGLDNASTGPLGLPHVSDGSSAHRTGHSTSVDSASSTSDRDARFWPSSLRDQEGKHPESLSSVEEERDDSFSSVIDLIRRNHDLEKPASATPARGLSTLSHALGLHAEASPDLHLPPSRLVDKVNFTFDKFVEDQTPSAFIPWPMKRQRRYYRTSKPLFAGPYTVPPGLSSLTLEKASELKKRLVVIPHNLVSSFETALAGVGEVVSWLDWWLATLSKFGDTLPKETRSNFQRMMVSGARSLKFLGSQMTPVLANLVLLRRDFLLSDVRSTVPAEELSRLATPRCLLLRYCFPRHSWTRPSVRHAPRPMTPWSTRHFIPQGSRSASHSNRTGRHRRRPLRRIDPGSPPSFPVSNKLSAATPRLPPRQEATAIGPARAKSLFATPRADPAAQGAAVKAQASVRTDQVPTPLRVGGGCLSLHWRQWQAIGANQWVVLSSGTDTVSHSDISSPPPPPP